MTQAVKIYHAERETGVKRGQGYKGPRGQAGISTTRNLAAYSLISLFIPFGFLLVIRGFAVHSTP
jgi:hypothetical protein